jgi:hypothetical protein
MIIFFNKTLAFIFLFIFIIIPFNSNAFDLDLLEIVKEDDFLISGNIGFIANNKGEFLISVGFSTFDENTATAQMEARNVAKLVAKQNLVEFIHEIKVKSESELTIYSEKQSDKNIKIKSLSEAIRSYSEGVIKNISDIGSWVDLSQRKIFYVYGITIKK